MALARSKPPPPMTPSDAPARSERGEGRAPLPSQPSSRVGFVPGRFVPDAQLEGWLRRGEAARTGPLLTMADGSRFVLSDALRVLGPRDAESDRLGFTGRVDSIRTFLRHGAAICSDGLRLGSAVYDVELGVVAYPLGSGDDGAGDPGALG